MLDTQHDPWLRNLPALHAVLAGNRTAARFPQAPGSGSDVFAACAYWEPLHYVLVTLLGWRNVGQGLRWWYDAGLPVEDPILRTVKAIWNRGPALDFLAAWAWNDADNYHRSGSGPTPLQPDLAWWRNLAAYGRPWPHDPFSGGLNPLHLGHSGEPITASLRTEHDPQLATHPPSRHAVLVARSFSTWKGELAAAGLALPAAHGRSWHVDVFDRRVGWLGTFRFSRITHTWFAGRHSVHMRGQ